MRTMAVALAAVMSLAGGAQVAGAGDPSDPDINDPCNEGHITTVPHAGVPVSHVLPWLDLQAGWIELAEDASALTVGLRACASAPADNPQNLAEGYFVLRWTNGGCTQRVTFMDHSPDGVVVQAAPGTAQRARLVQSGCGADVNLALDDALVVRAGDVIAWTLPLDGSLGPITDSLRPTPDSPVVLSSPRGFSEYHLGVQAFMEGDSTPAGRTVILTG